MKYSELAKDYRWVSTDEDPNRYQTFWALGQPNNENKCVKMAASQWYTDNCSNNENNVICQTGKGMARTYFLVKFHENKFTFSKIAYSA